MATTMDPYESSIAPAKKSLFSLISPSDTIADIGLGTGPNLRFLPPGARVIGIEPNRFMWPYATQNAAAHHIRLELVDAVSERVPLPSNSCDFVISTLTLCSVADPPAAVREMYRVLKPGGCLLFVEHVCAPQSRPVLRAVQNFLDPLQVVLADGCHLNRDTVALLEGGLNPGFTQVRFRQVHVDLGVPDILNPMRPHVVGFARK